MKVLIGVDVSIGGFAAVRQAGRLMDPDRDRAVLYYTPPEIRVGSTDPQMLELLNQVFASLPERLCAVTSQSAWRGKASAREVTALRSRTNTLAHAPLP